MVPHDHPLCFMSQGPAADDLRRNADVMLAVGSRIGNLDVPFDKYWGDPKRCKLIHVDVDPRNIGVSRPVALGIVADAKATLSGLVSRLRARRASSLQRKDLDALRAGQAAWKEAIQAQVAGWSGPGIHPAQACAVVGGVFGP